MPDPLNMGKPNPRYDILTPTTAYHRLPDRSPYDYFRTPWGTRLVFPREEIKSIAKDGMKIVLTSIFGYKFTVTSSRPELHAQPSNPRS